MRKNVFVAALVAAVCLPGMALAGGTKSANNYVNPGDVSGPALPDTTGAVGASFTNGVSAGASKGDSGCKVSWQFKGLTGIADGQEIICVSNSTVSVSGANLQVATGLVVKMVVTGGAAKAKLDLFAEGTGCNKSGGVNPVKAYASHVVCYEPDLAYGVGGCTPFTVNPALGGICAVSFAPRPASPILATQGIFFAP